MCTAGDLAPIIRLQHSGGAPTRGLLLLRVHCVSLSSSPRLTRILVGCD